jgi:hypothetical protein
MLTPIHIDLKGKRITAENEDYVWVESQAGENWHEFVLWTIDRRTWRTGKHVSQVM